MDFYIGQIVLVPNSKVPTNGKWLPCDGRVISQKINAEIHEYVAFHAIIGSKFGGDDRAFNIPNLRGLEPHPGLGYYICYDGGVYPG